MQANVSNENKNHMKSNHAKYEEIPSPNLYHDKNFNISAVKILPGEYYVTKRDLALVTVLGSCVAACIRDRHSGMGGMNHFMLPGDTGNAGNPADLSSPLAHYGTYAMEKMINDLLKMGAKRNNLQAKLFGGGNVMKGFTVNNVGERNAEFALNYLQTEKIELLAKDLLDVYPRKIYFFPNSGKVLVRKLRNVHNDTILEREQQYRSRIMVSTAQGKVDLF